MSRIKIKMVVTVHDTTNPNFESTQIIGLRRGQDSKNREFKNV